MLGLHKAKTLRHIIAAVTKQDAGCLYLSRVNYSVMRSLKLLSFIVHSSFTSLFCGSEWLEPLNQVEKSVTATLDLTPAHHHHYHHNPGHGEDIHSLWLWKPLKFPAPGAKILSEVPAPWYSAAQTKVPCVESAVTAFLKSPRQTLKSICKGRKRKHELRKQLMSN